jgi:hypothetical protein
MDFEHAVAQVAEQYRREGYQVTPRPGPDQVPPFVQGHDVAMKVRNALAHGMTVPDIDATLPHYIVSVARRLLSPDADTLRS